MNLLPELVDFAPELTRLRRDFHQNPEIGFEEHRTSVRIAELLESWGIPVTRGLGGTGLVGVIEGNSPGRSIGLRADMDALPMDEETNLPYASRNPGVFHGCGHDGHITMLLGAAWYLAQHRDFAGRAILIFQPAEEGLGGARAMLADGLFDRFPCDELYGLHNSPYNDFGEVTLRPGLAQAGAGFFDIRIKGRGSHGAMPQMARDPVLAGAVLVQALQGIVGRNIDPGHAAVVSVTRFQAGAAYNVIPDSAHLAGTVRYLDPGDRALIGDRMAQICAGVALAQDVAVDLELRNVFDILTNDPACVDHVIAAARGVVGDRARADAAITMGSEDMADLLQVVPGAFFNLGHGGEVPLHNPGFVFDDSVIPVGASLFVQLVRARGAA